MQSLTQGLAYFCNKEDIFSLQIDEKGKFLFASGKSKAKLCIYDIKQFRTRTVSGNDF